MDKQIFEDNGYRVCVADTQGQCEEVENLIRRMYSWRGYPVGAMDIFPPRDNRTVLQVCRGQSTVATLTVRVDSKSGLMADGLYRRELNALREFGGKVCELTGLAVSPGEDSRTVLDALFRSAYSLGRLYHGISDVVIEVNPRHVAHYRRVFGFRQLGPERHCTRVDAPAILLHLDLVDLVSGDRQDGALPEGASRSARQPYSSFLALRN